MIFAAFFAAGACMATPVHLDPLPQSGALAEVPWVQATPHRAGIVGMLFAHASTSTFALWPRGKTPTGGATKILWIVRNIHSGGGIVIRGREIGGTATFRQAFQQVQDASAQPAAGHEYASIVKLPHVGCWRLDVSSGGARGTLIVAAVEP